MGNALESESALDKSSVMSHYMHLHWEWDSRNCLLMCELFVLLFDAGSVDEDCYVVSYQIVPNFEILQTSSINMSDIYKHMCKHMKIVTMYMYYQQLHNVILPDLKEGLLDGNLLDPSLLRLSGSSSESDSQ